MSGTPATSQSAQSSQGMSIQSVAAINGISGAANSNIATISHNSLANGHQSDLMSNGHNSDTSIPSPSDESYKLQTNPLTFKRETIETEVNSF